MISEETPTEPTVKISRNDIKSLLYKSLEKVKKIKKEIFDKICFEYEWLSKVLEIKNSFKEILEKRDIDKFEVWINICKELKSSELNSFLKGIERDKEAVKNAIIYRYTNGLAEGSVNKLETLKIIMYGRASFKTLRTKILGYEKNR